MDHIVHRLTYAWVDMYIDRLEYNLFKTSAAQVMSPVPVRRLLHFPVDRRHGPPERRRRRRFSTYVASFATFPAPSEIYDTATIFSGCPSFATCDSPGPDGSKSDGSLHRFFPRLTTTLPSVYKLVELIEIFPFFPENFRYFLSTLCPNSKFYSQC